MKEIKALIRPDRFGAVLETLHTHPELPGVTVSEVRGFGRTVGRPAASDTGRVRFGTTKMFKVECVVNDEMLDTVVGIIQAAAHTGQAGDGKIMTYDVPDTMEIRTGARLKRIE